MSDPEESTGYEAETAGVDEPEILEVVGVDREAREALRAGLDGASMG